MVIYMAVNVVNNRCYVGQTRNTLAHRRSRHYYTAFSTKSATAFHTALRKYGKDNFVWYEVADCASLEELNQKEAHYIEYFNTTAPFGYNLDSGGAEFTRSNETRDKLRAANLGKKATPEARRNMSEAHKSSPAAIAAIRTAQRARLGSKLTQEHRDKIRAGNLGKVVSQETIAKIRAACSVPTVLEHIATGEIREFTSVTEAAKSIGAAQGNVSKMLAGEKGRKSLKGWRVPRGT